jgi:urease accessory protein
MTHAPHTFAAYLDEPLPQRPAGSIGKNGKCNLSFVANQGRTQLHRSYITHPFHLTSPWRLDPHLPGMAVVYLQTPAGGLIQGDRAQMQFTFGPHTQVHLTTQAAEKIHSMNTNCAIQQASFALDVGAYAEYCPEPVILFPGARFSQTIDVTLAEKAQFFLSEIFFSRRADNGASFEAFVSALQVRDANTGVLLHDRSCIFPQQHDLAGPGILGGYQTWGQALLIGPTIPPTWVRELHALLATEPDALCGVTLLHKARGVYMKAVGSEVRTVRRVLHRAWDYLRTHFLQAPAPVFPK